MQVTFLRKLCDQRKIGAKCANFLSVHLSQEVVQFSTSEHDENHKERKEFKKPEWINFSHAKHGKFYQKVPQLDNPFLSDVPLRSFLNRHVPNEVNKVISDDLERFGSRIVHEVDNLGWECELNPPSLETQSAWGQRIDELTTCGAWKQQHDICAEEGLVAIAYEQKLGHWSRLHQICKMYLYMPSSGLYSCPLAMTDGAAKTIMAEKKSFTDKKHEIFKKAFYNLISRDPTKFWTSGQWMTEKKGGSDVALSTDTVAVPDEDSYRLYGYKWFSSASDANMAFTLARISRSAEELQEAKRLTMFYVETRDPRGQLNGIQMVKLKNKLGTRQLPTAELLLDGTVAHKMSEEGRGISSICHMLNVTRLHNSLAAVSVMRRILMLSRNYCQNRNAFGKLLSKTPLHMRILSKMEVETRGSLLLLLKVAIILGKTELSVHSADELLLLRILLPVIKLYTAKQAVAVVSEGLETFGGQGYIEDTRLPVLLRDAQVLPIWEGTTNVLSMDVIRSLAKTNFEALLALERSAILHLEPGKLNLELTNSCMLVEKSINCILHFVKSHPNRLEIAARDIAYSIARSYIGALLIENAAVTRKQTDVFTAQQWCEMQDLCPLSLHKNYTGYVENDFKNVMEGNMNL